MPSDLLACFSALTTQPPYLNNLIQLDSNGDISAADRLIYSVFGSRVGFSGSADRMALIPV